MTSIRPRKPIADQFRLAARSCNEWRDTLFYTGLLALNVASKRWNLGIDTDSLIEVAGWREMARSAAWNPEISKKANSLHSCFSAVAVFNALFLVSAVVQGVAIHQPAHFLLSHPLMRGVQFGLLSLGIHRSGGVKAIWNDYKNKMFDYPRKIKPPNKPHKKPALEKLREAWNGIKDRLGVPAPQGAFAPIRVRAQHSNELVS